VKTGDLFLNSDVHVRRGGTDEKPNIVIVKGGRLVSETDLTTKEVDDVKKHGVLRAPTLEEIQASENRDENESAAEAQRAAADDAAELAAEQKIEKDRLESEQKAEAGKARQKLEEKQAKDRADAEKTAAGSGGKSKK
jgi:hypothetical protein